MSDRVLGGGVLHSECGFHAPNSPALTSETPRNFLRSVTDLLAVERERFVLWVPVIFGTGIGLYFAISQEPSLWAVLTIAAVAAGLWLSLRRQGGGSFVSSILFILALGLTAAKVRVEEVRAPVLQKRLSNIDVEGTIELIEPRGQRAQRITLTAVKIANFAPNQTPAKVRLRLGKADNTLRPGTRIKLKAVLSPPARPAYPGGFDFARSAWFQQLGGVGYATGPPQILPVIEDGSLLSTFRRGVEQLRQDIGARVAAALPGEAGSMAQALITGERGGISAETVDQYRDAGLLHILSISGLHMAIMAGTVYYAVRLVLALIPAIALRFEIKKWAALAGMAGALSYLVISGSSYPTVRATITILIFFTAVLLDRPAIALRNVALAALAILIIFPESLLDVGFQMSFAAVVALVGIYEEVTSRLEKREEHGRLLKIAMFFGGIVFSTIIASLAVAPFGIYHFQKSQQFAILANLIAIPICNFLVMPAAMLALLLMPLGLESLALWPMSFGISAMTWCAGWVADLPGAVGRLPAIPAAAFYLMVIGGLWLVLWRTRLRLFGLPILLSGVALTPYEPRPDLLVSRSGELVAVRGTDGLLSALPARNSNFDLSRWLERDGDGRTLNDVRKASAFRCDGIGCTVSVDKQIDQSGNAGGRNSPNHLTPPQRVAVSRHPASVPDDCAAASILILPTPRPKHCTQPRLVIDFFDVYREGTHAVFFDANGQWRVTTVQAQRGNRPWSRKVEIGRDVGATSKQSRSTSSAGRDSARKDAPGAMIPPDSAQPSREHKTAPADKAQPMPDQSPTMLDPDSRSQDDTFEHGDDPAEAEASQDDSETLPPPAGDNPANNNQDAEPQ